MDVAVGFVLSFFLPKEKLNLCVVFLAFRLHNYSSISIQITRWWFRCCRDSLTCRSWCVLFDRLCVILHLLLNRFRNSLWTRKHWCDYLYRLRKYSRLDLWHSKHYVQLRCWTSWYWWDELNVKVKKIICFSSLFRWIRIFITWKSNYSQWWRNISGCRCTFTIHRKTSLCLRADRSTLWFQIDELEFFSSSCSWIKRNKNRKNSELVLKFHNGSPMLIGNEVYLRRKFAH